MAKQESVLESLANLCGDTDFTNIPDEFIPSGSVIFDSVLSDGKGIPRSKFILLSSDSGLGKTTLALHVCKAVCAQGYACLYLDAEKGVNQPQLQAIGLDPFYGKMFFLKRISTFDEASDALDAVLKENDEKLGLIIIDSITALLPAKVLDKNFNEDTPGIQARAQSLFIQKQKAFLEKLNNKVTFLLINQLRTKIGMGYGQRTTVEEAGGYALKFYSDIRLMMQKKETLKKNATTANGREEVPFGSINYLWAVKNRFARPFIKVPLTVIFGKGVSNIQAYFQALEQLGIITHSGAAYRCALEPLGIDTSESHKDTPGFYKCAGMPKMSAFVKKYLANVKDYINSQGGIMLVKEEKTDASFND